MRTTASIIDVDMSDAGAESCEGDRDERPFHTHNGRNSCTQRAVQSKEGGAEREELATCVNLPGLGMM